MSKLATVTRYKSIKAQIEALEAQLKPLKEELELEALNQGGHFIVGVYNVKLVEASREVFSLKDAKCVLGSALNPFIKMSHYTQLRIS